MIRTSPIAGRASFSKPCLGAAREPHGLTRERGLLSMAVGIGFQEKRRDRARSTIVVERDIEPVADRHNAPLGAFEGLGDDLDPRFDRRPPDVCHLRVQLDALANVDRPQERERIDGGGRDASSAGMPERGDAAALVGKAQQHAPMEGPERVCLAGVGDDRQAQPRGRRRFGLVWFNLHDADRCLVR